MPPVDLIGKRIALHAAKSWDADAIPMFIRLELEHPGRKDLYETSAIVGVATIDRVVTTAKTLAPDQARWFFGDFGWILTDRRKLPKPIPWKGAQGLRTLPPLVEWEIERQLAGEISGSAKKSPAMS